MSDLYIYAEFQKLKLFSRLLQDLFSYIYIFLSFFGWGGGVKCTRQHATEKENFFGNKYETNFKNNEIKKKFAKKSKENTDMTLLKTVLINAIF